MTASRSLGFEVALESGFDRAIARVTEALKAEGFGVLTRIDMHATLRDKLGVAFRPYAILGVCNPPLAHRALERNAQAGLLLPCNVTVEETAPGRALVCVGDPEIMMAAGGMESDPVLRGVGSEARARLLRVTEALRAAG